MPDSRAGRKSLWMRCLPLAGAVCALLWPGVAAGAETAGSQRRVRDTAVSVRAMPNGWVSNIAMPVKIDAASRSGGTLRLVFTGGGKRQIRTVQLAPGKPARIELPLYSGTNGRVEWSLGDESGYEAVGWPYGFDGVLPPIIAVNAFILRDLEAVEQRSRERRTLASLPVQELPSDWQSYAGLNSVIAMDADDAGRLTPAQCQALAQWIKWFGGVLWLGGDGGERALARLGLPLSLATVIDRPFGKEATYLNGVVRLAEIPNASVIYLDGAAPRELFNPRWIGYGADLLESLGEIPVSFIVLSLVLLGLFLGPVTYWIVRQKKNPLLFFFIVPAAALFGTACIVGGAFFLEGVGGEYNQIAVLARHAGGNSSMFFDMRGVRPGFVVPEVKFGADAMALPFSDNRDEKTIDTTDGVRLVAGWLRPRFATGYLTLRPVVSRMNVEVHPDGDGYKAVNNLGYRVQKMAAFLPDGTLGWAENIPAGGSVPFETERGTRRYEELCRQLDVLNEQTPPVANVLLVAQADGLPYADDGGLGGALREGKFFYVLAGNRELLDEKRGADNGQ